MGQPLYLYNTETREKEKFIPIEEGQVGLYTCGPTVYNRAHIGNFRAFVFDDLLHRTLTYLGYNLTHVMNITDIGHLSDDADEGEDKMVAAARKEGRGVLDIARHFEGLFLQDMEALGICRPTVMPRATDHIQQMVEFVKVLIDKGFTYSAGGNIYFDTSKVHDYGRLAPHLEREDAVARVAADSNKKHPSDFVLWFTQSKFTSQALKWNSPWGTGYPGWHLECSVMSTKYLGEHFDIHCGGVDHINIHHTNEIAQSEAYSGHKWVNYWMHNAFLVLKTEKMSKSLGNFLTLASITEHGLSPLDYRYFLYQTHYRKPAVFTWEAAEAAASGRKSLQQAVQGLGISQKQAEAGQLTAKGQEAYDKMLSALLDDLQAPTMLGLLRAFLRDPGLTDMDKFKLSLFGEQIFGFGLFDEEKSETLRLSDLPETARSLALEREQARQSRNFERSDALRASLLEEGYEVTDLKGETCYRKI